MIDLILILLLNSFLCIGIHEAVQYDIVKTFDIEKSVYSDNIRDKMVLWFVKFYGDKHLSIWIRKPLYDCVICMASIWSLPVFFLFVDLPIYFIIIYIPALAGVNTLINGIINKLY